MKVCQLVLLLFTMFFNIVTSWASYTCDLFGKRVGLSFYFFRCDFDFQVLVFNSVPTTETFKEHLFQYIKKLESKTVDVLNHFRCFEVLNFIGSRAQKNHPSVAAAVYNIKLFNLESWGTTQSWFHEKWIKIID